MWLWEGYYIVSIDHRSCNCGAVGRRFAVTSRGRETEQFHPKGGVRSAGVLQSSSETEAIYAQWKLIMQFRGQEYYQAALERLCQADTLYAKGDAYALAMYCGGLSVECLLRAFRWKEDPRFEGRHDLNVLLKASRILRVDEEYLRRKGKADEDIRGSSVAFRGAMNEIASLWHNNLRFASETRLKAYLVQIKRVRGKGDPLKRNAADLISAARLVVDRGRVLWS